MSISHIITETLSSSSIYAAVLGTVLFIGIGFITTKQGLFTKEINGKISKFVFTWLFPFIGITSFMQAPDKMVANVLGIVLSLSIAFYLIGIIASWAIVKWVPNLISQKIMDQSFKMWIKSKPKIYIQKYRDYYVDEFRKKLIIGQSLTVYSSISFFAIPLVRALPDVFGPSGIGLLWIWHITFSILFNSHPRVVISGQKLQKSEIKDIAKNAFNLTLIFTLLSLIIWATQFISPDQKLKEWFSPATIEEGVQKTPQIASTFWDLKITLPLVFKPLSIGIGLLSPLIWLVIGGSLASSNFKAGIKDKGVWIFSSLKLIVVPLILFLVMIIFVKTKILSWQVGTLIVIMQSVPPATIITVYAIRWNVRPDYSSQITSLSTVFSLITIPFWVITSRIVFQSISQ